MRSAGSYAGCPVQPCTLSSLPVISMRENENQIKRGDKHAVPATSEGTPPYTDPLPAPDVAAPDDTPRPTLPPRHMIDDPERPGDNSTDLRKR